ncbi:hypothetical protein GGH12_002593 [Coemansia sp. RSA 1822]|nr:hypothetical protein LPJ76_003754 [Coemansia sp. RSA 638]KAJ2563416.1 hypothetical protein GGH12_002593 [Coemansia sp. RSA 1822]
MRTSRIVGYAAAFLSTSSVLAFPTIFTRDVGVSAVPRIVGGEVITDDDFRFVAFIEGRGSDGSGTTCTGSLIAPNVVLTAAHCTMAGPNVHYDASAYQIGFNHTTPSMKTTFKGYSVSKVAVYPDFNEKSLRNDLALLILEEEIPSTVAESVKIYSGDVLSSTQLFAAGFGITNPEDTSSVPAELMKVELKPGNDTFCAHNTVGYDPKYLVCTDGTPGKDTCQGDSGGPLATSVGETIALVGITSYAPLTESNPDGLCGQAGSTGYYVHISAYLSWIAGIIEAQESDISIGAGQGTNTSLSENPTATESKSESESEIESKTESSSSSTVSIISESGDVTVADTTWDSSTNNGIGGIGSSFASIISVSSKSDSATESTNGNTVVVSPTSDINWSSTNAQSELGELTDSDSFDPSSSESYGSSESSSFDSSVESTASKESIGSGEGLDTEGITDSESDESDISSSLTSTGNDEEYSPSILDLFSFDDPATMEHMLDSDNSKAIIIAPKYNIPITLLGVAVAFFLL